ncbi:MAG: hypothetical protein IMZ64_01140 [Bacteroidetes bacterium]|nr:hypothetical protein [Bacteroidota bacterium]
MIDLETKTVIATGKAMNISDRKIAQATGLSHSAVGRQKNREDVREMIDAAREKLLVDNLKPATEAIVHLISGYQKNKAETKQEAYEKDHGFKAIMRVQEAAGILPSNIQNLYIQQIYNDNREVPEAIQKLLGAIQERDLVKPISNVVEGELEDAGN